MIKKLEEKYAKKEEEEMLQVRERQDAEWSGEEDDDVQMVEETQQEADLARDVNLPSNLDSKLWRVKVKPGSERILVMKLTNKLIANLNDGHPLMVLQVFECETSPGSIFLEAHKLSHVEQLTRGISGLYTRGVRMIPISEMTDVMKSCSVMKECNVEQRQWVRIKKGPFKDDLALVEEVVNHRQVILRVIPRIPDLWIN